MGHANLRNLSEFFINRLYAKGNVSINDCIQAMQKHGVALQASEAAYDVDAMLGMGLQDVIHYLALENPQEHGYSGPGREGVGPWIEPVLDVWLGSATQARRLSSTARALLKQCVKTPEDETQHRATADKLEEEGFTDWSAHVRTLLRQRQLFQQWSEPQGCERWEEAEYAVFDRIPWRFTKGWRKRYRDVPRLGNVTH
jgi:hypothetical protein